MAGNLFAWNGLSFLQSDLVFKIGTDALLLASWTPRVVRTAERVMDAGTGTGFLAIAMCQAYPGSTVEALDMHPDSHSLACHNVQRNSFSDRCVVTLANVLDYPVGRKSLFDLLVTNPPYFGHHVPSAENHEALARHRVYGPAAWMSGSIAMLRPAGHLCMVVPFADARAWIRAANELGWYVRDRLDVWSKVGDETPFRTLLHFTAQLTRPNAASLVMCDTQGEWHPDFIRWRGYARADEPDS